MRPARLQAVRVLFLDHVPRLSGAEQSLADLVVGLAAGPVEPVVVLPGDGPLAAELRAQGVLVRMVPMSRRLLEVSRTTLARRPFAAVARTLAFLAAGARLYRLMREVRPDIVHSNTLKSHLVAILPCWFARVPLVWHVRDILPGGWLRRAFVACARFPVAVIVPSRAVAEPFKRNRAVFKKLRLIPNGVRVADFQEAKRDRSLRDLVDAGPADLVIGIVGRIAPWKGQEVFLRAAAMLAQRHPRVRFAVIGDVLFPENDAAFLQHLQMMAIQLGIDDRVHFLGWQPAPEAMAALDVFVHASQEPEPFGRAIVEAMAAGKPVVAAAGGATTELVPPAAGFIVPPSRPELLADALDRLVSDKKLRKRMGEAGAAIADTFFPVQRTVQSVAQLYRQLAPRRRRRSPRLRRRMRQAPRPALDATTQWAHPDVALQPPAVRRRAAVEPQPRRPHNPAPPSTGAHSPSRAATYDAPVEPRRQGNERARPPRDEGPRGNASRSIPARRPSPRGGFSHGAAGAALADLPAAVVQRERVSVRVAEAEHVFVPRPAYDVLKRLLDLVLALAITVLGMPLWLLIALSIKLESPGPVLFRAVAVGRNGKRFTYFKFRSMRVDGDDNGHRKFIERYVLQNGGHEHQGQIVYKYKGDDRITAVGRWIRTFSLDEIPQIINVVRGEMSFVGPRPPLDYEYDLYDERAKQRLRVQPGITGMQQVWSRDQASFEKKLELDLRYIRNRSLWLDLKLIAHTILAIPRGH